MVRVSCMSIGPAVRRICSVAVSIAVSSVIWDDEMIELGSKEVDGGFERADIGRCICQLCRDGFTIGS